MQHLQPNTTLQGGRYKIKDVLGQGGFGITYLAKDNSLGVYVAVKEFFMKDLCSRDEATLTMNSSGGSLKQVERYREKFIKEARNLSRLHHLHIISVIDVFEENGTVYYSMPYLKGGSLQDYVKSRGPLTEVEAMKIIRQIADALKYMHEVEHICHYDVKPSNILLDDRGNAMLIDFGIAKNYDESGHETSTTPIGMSEGYAPIEQYQQNVEEFSPASDVYGLGATLLFAMTGKRPTSVIERVGGTPLEMPRYCSEPIKELIFSSMIIQRKYRPQSTKKFLEYNLPKVAPSPVVSASDESTLVDQEPRQRFQNVDVVDERTFTAHKYDSQPNVQPHTSQSHYQNVSQNKEAKSKNKTKPILVFLIGLGIIAILYVSALNYKKTLDREAILQERTLYQAQLDSLNIEKQRLENMDNQLVEMLTTDPNDQEVKQLLGQIQEERVRVVYAFNKASEYLKSAKSRLAEIEDNE